MSAVERLRLLESAWPDLPAFLVVWRVAEDWPVEYVSENITRLAARGESVFCAMDHAAAA